METPTSLRLLASTNNARGDLFTRLVKDLFFALGYDGPRLDVHNTGREIDVQGTHRLEPRRLVLWSGLRVRTPIRSATTAGSEIPTGAWSSSATDNRSVQAPSRGRSAS